MNRTIESYTPNPNAAKIRVRRGISHYSYELPSLTLYSLQLVVLASTLHCDKTVSQAALHLRAA